VAHDIQKFQAVARPQGSLICKGEAACRPASIASTRAGRAAGVPGQTAPQLTALPERIESAFPPRERLPGSTGFIVVQKILLNLRFPVFDSKRASYQSDLPAQMLSANYRRASRDAGLPARNNKVSPKGNIAQVRRSARSGR
jgi:hypothetical protein